MVVQNFDTLNFGDAGTIDTDRSTQADLHLTRLQRRARLQQANLWLHLTVEAAASEWDAHIEQFYAGDAFRLQPAMFGW